MAVDEPLPSRRDDLTAVAASGAPFQVPLSETHAVDLVAGLPIAPGRHVLDLGCGFGELLMRVVAANPATTGTGVENVQPALWRAHRGLVERALAERVEFVEDDPATFRDLGSLVIALQAPALFGPEGWPEAVRDRLEPGGVALVGADVAADSAEAGELPTHDAVVASATLAGYRILRSDRATREELDAYETAVRTGLARLSGEAEAERRLRSYEGGPLHERGFALLVLGV